MIQMSMIFMSMYSNNYPLDFILDLIIYWILYWIIGGFYQKSVYFIKIGSNTRTGFSLDLYWIIGGFLLNIKSTRFYLKFTRFPHLDLVTHLIDISNL